VSDARTGRVGTVINGKWQIDARIGTGGMATVYAATHRNGLRAAIKMLHGQLSRDSSTRARFLREGYVANAVRHPGVVAVLDDGVAEDGCAFLVLELLEGETLDSRRERLGGTLPLDEVLAFADQALDALAAAHVQGVVHRDVKPENLFVTKDGTIKLLDFGLARMKNAQAEATKTGVTIGTPEFMPPEQAMGRRDTVDARSDVWGLGATLFTAITGRYVHEDAQTIHEQLVASATQRSKPIRQLAPHVPSSVAKVIDRALELEMSDRWQSASEMQMALRAASPSEVATIATPRMKPPPQVSKDLPTSSDETMKLSHERTTNQRAPKYADADIEETFVDEARTLLSPGANSPRGGSKAPDKTSRIAAQRGAEPTPRGLGNPKPTAPAALTPMGSGRPPPPNAYRASFVPAPPPDELGGRSPPRALTVEEAMEPTVATPRAYLRTPTRPSNSPPSPMNMPSAMSIHPGSPAPSPPAFGVTPHHHHHAGRDVPISPGTPRAVPLPLSASNSASDPLSGHVTSLPRQDPRSSGRIIALVAMALVMLCAAMGAYVLWRSPR
jgi:eukaryotic-like serine/threonine-protein kinase